MADSIVPLDGRESVAKLFKTQFVADGGSRRTVRYLKLKFVVTVAVSQSPIPCPNGRRVKILRLRVRRARLWQFVDRRVARDEIDQWVPNGLDGLAAVLAGAESIIPPFDGHNVVAVQRDARVPARSRRVYGRKKFA